MLQNHRLIGLCLLVINLFASSDLYAQDIFVKPSQPSEHPVDLGLGIKPTAQPPQPHVAQPPAQQIPAQQPTPQHTQVAPIQQPHIQPQPVQQPIPEPTPPPVIQTGHVEIIPVPDAPVSIPPGSGSNLFNIAIQTGSMGQTEVNDISKTLGLNGQEIATNCVYENMVVLSIADSGSAISMGQLTNAQQRFSGDLKSIDIFPTIACKKIRRPVNGMVIEQGAYYKISAQNVTCPPPHSGNINLTFKYLGNGKADCQYK
ncbi:MAG: hypothetical protein K2Q32_04940 [Alphaproteobacteria bacterium]|nr:hypothetical protein [Alphaproteobacteria bacterium]